VSDASRVRVSIVGVVIVALFSSLLARLWFLQMGSEAKLKAEAIALSTRRIQTPSPRGRILDRDGRVLASDRAAWALTVDRDLDGAVHERVMGQLSELLGVPEESLERAFASPRQTPLKPAVVAIDIDQDKRLAILQHRDDYPGVRVARLTVREYPAARQLRHELLAAQVLGYVGEIGPDQLKRLKRQGYQPGDLIGREGVEAAYERWLRGDPQVETVQVDPTGKQVGPPLSVHRGAVGHDVYLTIDAEVQRAAERALLAGIMRARTLKDSTITDRYATLQAPAGAVVVLDARDGSVVAMASSPAFPPSKWAGGIDEADFAALNDPASHYPLVNRATQGQYAPGSTFKLVTALAQTRYGFRGVDEYYQDTGSVRIGGDRQLFTNDNNAVNGPVNLARALAVSSDTYFYTIGEMFWNVWRGGDTARGLGLGQQARDVGFGAKTGLELGEAPGRIPDPAWKQQFANSYYKTREERVANGVWYPGDVVQLAVGQGDVLVTPLQLAGAYATFANGGTLWNPHVGSVVKDPVTGRVVHEVAPKARHTVAIDAYVRAQMMAGFKSVVQDTRGTAYEAFRGFPFSAVPGGVAGKTGTAQVAGKGSTSLFAAYFPADAPEYVVVALVEEGGHGARVAAPIVRQVIEHMLGLPLTPIEEVAGND
jgi:penicillin-binding protein 2